MEENNIKPESKTGFLVSAIKSVTEGTEPTATLPLFLGGDDEIHKAIMETAVAYVSFGRAKEKGLSKEAEIFKNKFNELREKHFPELSAEDAGAYCTVYFQFSRRYLNRSVNNIDELIENDDFINRVITRIADRGDDPIPLVFPIIGTVKPTLDKRDRMRRRHFGGPTQVADTFTVYLYNSFIAVKVKRPSRLEYVNLINDIELKLRYFGERWVVNSINLERAGIAKLITEFFLDHVIQHSVEGILSNQELANYILANDIDTIALQLLQAASPKGTYYNMTCLANQCNHSELVLVQPYDLMLLNDADMDQDQRDLWIRIRDRLEQVSVEDILKCQNRYKYKGKEVNLAVKLFSELGDSEGKAPYGQFTLGVPSLSEYFTTFALMAEKYDPTFKKYAIDYPSVEAYRKKRSEFVGATRMGEYVHWIKEQVTFGKGEQPNEVETRGDDQRGFEDGLLDIFSDDDEAYWRTFSGIMENIPYASHVFIGFRNSDCPKCGTRAGTPVIENGVEKPKTVSDFTAATGFTPIDIVTSFFDHTRMLIEEMGSQQRLQEEIIS